MSKKKNKNKSFPDLLKESSDSLVEALKIYWPTRDEWDVQEAHVVTHLAHVLMEAGWAVYPEVPVTRPGKKNGRLDLLAIHTESRRMLVVEAKRLWSQKNAVAINDDIDKLSNATLPMPVDDDLITERWIIVLTHKDDLPVWWTDPVPEKRPMELKDKHVAAWEALEANLSKHRSSERVVIGPYQGPQLKRPVSVVAAQITEAAQPTESS